MINAKEAHREKTTVALSSVGAAIGLTSLKLIVGILTGSLGSLAEAAHSGLDLIAALMTFFAVRVADRPADATHHYGHEKVENLSAFFHVPLTAPESTRNRKPEKLDLVLHTIFDAHAPLSQVHIVAEEIKRALRQAYPNLDSVVIHTEPPEQ